MEEKTMGTSKIPVATTTFNLDDGTYRTIIERSEPGKGKGAGRWFIHFKIEGTSTTFIQSFPYPLHEGSPIAEFAERAARKYDLCEETDFVGVGVTITVENKKYDDRTISIVTDLKFRTKGGALIVRAEKED